MSAVLSTREAAVILGIHRAKVSPIMRGAGFEPVGKNPTWSGENMWSSADVTSLLECCRHPLVVERERTLRQRAAADQIRGKP